MSDHHSKLNELITQLKQERDELKLQVHLGKQEIRDEWDKLQVKLDELSDRSAAVKDAMQESAEGVWESLKLVGEEIRDGFKRIRDSL